MSRLRCSPRLIRNELVLLIVPCLAALCVSYGLHNSPQQDSAPTRLNTDIVTISSGMLRGVVHNHYRVFEGIPYAAPPLGKLRLRPPHHVSSWKGIRDATKPGPWCIQPNMAQTGLDSHASEDCLTLNIWTPVNRINRPLAVMVWIHGGSFIRGSGDLYRAERFVSNHPIIVVTINYRLGALGFLANPLGKISGNYGLADQQAALRWVRTNIATFGGDPNRITLAGESAGGVSVCDHLVSPESRGLFQAAIIQSGPCRSQITLHQAQKISRKYLAQLGCLPHGVTSSLVRQCLERLPAESFAQPLWYFKFGSDSLSGPVVGGPGLPQEPLEAITTNNFASVPLLIGTTRDEFRILEAGRIFHVGHLMTQKEYSQILIDLFGSQKGIMLQQRYPPKKYQGMASLAYASLITDSLFSCVSDRIITSSSARHRQIYAYEFTDPRPPVSSPFDRGPFPMGASHSLELPYLFDIGNVNSLTQDQQALSAHMINYWAHFVITGSPNSSGMTFWPIATDTGAWMQLAPQTDSLITDFHQQHQCELWQ